MAEIHLDTQGHISQPAAGTTSHNQVRAHGHAPTLPKLNQRAKIDPTQLVYGQTSKSKEAAYAYELIHVDPRLLHFQAPDRVDDVLRSTSPVVTMLEAFGIIQPIAIDDSNRVYPGHGRTRVIWALDRKRSEVPVIRIRVSGVDPDDIYRVLAIEDLKQTLSYERAMIHLRHFLPKIREIHNDEKQRRRLLKNDKIRSTLKSKKDDSIPEEPDPLAHHKQEFDEGDSWDKYEVSKPQSKRTYDKKSRFRVEATIAHFFGDAKGETFWRKVLELLQAEAQTDPPILNIGIRSRRERLGRGEYSSDGICRLIRKVRRAANLKRSLADGFGFDEKKARMFKEWIFDRIRRDNCWTWDRANPFFGLFKQIKEFKESARRQHPGDPEDFEQYFHGAYPGADIVLNILAYTTEPGDLLVDFHAGSGASKDAATHFLDPFWPTECGDYIYWHHWRDEFYELYDHKRGKPNLSQLVFPPNYFEVDGVPVDHSRRCLQFDICPNPLALKHFGPDFILQHDILDGISPEIEDQIRTASPEGAKVIYLDPPYGSQNMYGSDPNDLCNFSMAKLIDVLSEFIHECKRILHPSGRICLLMGSDWRQENLFDPGREIVDNVGAWFEYDDAGPLGPRIWVPTKSVALRRARARKARLRRLANRQRYLHILVPKTRYQTERKEL